MKTDDWQERERKRVMARQDALERAKLGIDNDLLAWVLQFGRDPVSLVGINEVAIISRASNLQNAGYVVSGWDLAEKNRSVWFSSQVIYQLTNKAETRLKHLFKRHNRSNTK